MNFETFYKSLNNKQKANLAERLSTSVAYLGQLASGHRKAGAKVLLSIEKATDGKVTPKDMRPELETPHE